MRFGEELNMVYLYDGLPTKEKCSLTWDNQTEERKVITARAWMSAPREKLPFHMPGFWNYNINSHILRRVVKRSFGTILFNGRHECCRN